MGKAELKIEIDEDLLARAEAAGLSLSELTEAAVRDALAAAASEPDTPEGRAARWAREHADTIRAHNEAVERRGVFGAEFRRW